MECLDVKKQFDSFYDNELTDENRFEIQSHLNFCESCRNEFESLKSVGILLKKELPVYASNELDAKVLAAFNQRHKKESSWNLPAIFSGFMIPRPVLAFGILTLLAFTGVAFLVGRMSASTTQIVVNNPSSGNETPKNVENNNLPIVKEVVKYVEVPTTKYVPIPVEKEKIVTRTVYRTIEKHQRGKPLTQVARNTVIKTQNDSNQLDLKDFQPTIDLNPQILKKGETNEK
jgi:hypothetical protein